MKVRSLSSAVGDLARGRDFYERQGAGLGLRFLESLFGEIDSLAQLGGIHLRVFGFHRMIARRFPYAIYYRVERSEVIVFRVLDCREDPQRLVGKIRSAE